MSEWISVKDRLPPDGECVDIWFKVDAGYNQGDEGRLTNFFLSDDKKSFFYCRNGGKSYIPIEGITHWMPLPEPPEN